MISLPPTLGGTSLPVSSTTAASTPKNGKVALPGLVGVAPGNGGIMIPPVSGCHQVSTIGHRPPPITVWYQIQASGLIGSPTVPSNRKLERSCFWGQDWPHLINVRMAVGAV